MSGLISIVLDEPTDYDAWRSRVRELIQDGIAPEQVSFGSAGCSGDLFGAAAPSAGARRALRRSSEVRVPRNFPKLARQVLCHRDAGRHALLYRLLWRVQASPRLLENEADGDVHAAKRLAQAVRRDVHKMKAFVRFRRVETEEGEAFVAWFEPEHSIVKLAATFFAERFAGMRWSIVTPACSVHWDGQALAFDSGARRQDCPDDDALEAHWRVYYSSIFNPARLKVNAMRAEMPKKYWKNLPESRLIPELTRSAERAQRAAPAGSSPSAASARRLVAAQPQQTVAVEGRPDSLAAVRAAVSQCARCDLCHFATTAVPGVGPADAPIMVVGEQPGDQEDLAGRPFIGPAGQELDAALLAAGIDREQTYLTNAVKHFKFVPRGKRRIHQRPTFGEVDHCRWWLDLEREIVAPRMTVALGATAARAVLGRTVSVTAERGRVMGDARTGGIVVTTHPAYLLRLPEREAVEQRRRFVADLRLAQEVAEA
ncbi:MAG: UdgX family uracil-DNA binding protein [Pseudomonadota bacterium]